VSDPLKQCMEGATPPNVALMRLFIVSRSEEDARAALERAIANAHACDDRTAAARLIAIREHWAGSPDAYRMVASIHDLARTEFHGTAEARIRQCAELFDKAAAISPQAGVALYSLGNEQLLDAATGELVALVRRWRLYDATSEVLDLGCGSGRLLEAIAPGVRAITGLDVSEAMLSAAARRTAQFGNVSLVRGTGRDLSVLDDRQFHLIIAVDSFPYLVMAGVAEDHFRDCSQRLHPGGRLLILNYSYRQNLEQDSAELVKLSQRHGLTITQSGTRELKLWDGAAYLFEKPI
jgi:predicted TPR repeat methyltransferase